MAASTNNWSLSAIITLLLIAAMTIGTELSPGLKIFLETNLWHHWIAKGIISMVVFVVLGFAFSKLQVTEKFSKDEAWWLGAVLVSAFVAGLIISGFYFNHYFGWL